MLHKIGKKKILENAQNKNSAGHKQHYFYYNYISPSIVQFFYYMCLYSLYKCYIQVCIINSVGFVRAMQDFAHTYKYKYIYQSI